ncbi:Hypothetical protein, putative [Bodo saltans]|uniref:Uncharacterized protein n=1 Tax=Bodo saltans TaxID=75058 RepID=A0A0S4JK27_BODSA|nr:Hypothetical protein, putative [Bodo saltans]|eukprot:CUG91844.1 Hypothetical protein, putative [Bodo saltans]
MRRITAMTVVRWRLHQAPIISLQAGMRYHAPSLVTTTELPASASLERLNASLRRVLTPNSEIVNARGRLEAASAMLGTLGARGAIIAPMVALELLRLLVDNLDNESFTWLEPSQSVSLERSAETNASPMLTTLSNCCLCILRSLIGGFLENDIQSRRRIVDKYVAVLQPHAFRLVVGCPMLCSHLEPSRTEDTNGIHSDVAVLIRSVCELWGDNALTAHESGLPRPPLKYVPTTLSAVLPAIRWAVAHDTNGRAPLYLMLVRSAYAVTRASSEEESSSYALMAATFGWASSTTALERNEMDKVAVRWFLAEILFSLSPAESSCGPEALIQRLHRDLDTPVLTTALTILDDVRLRQVLLHLAKLNANAQVFDSDHNCCAVVVDMVANREVSIENEVRQGGGAKGLPLLEVLQATGADTYLRCLLPLKSWLDVISSDAKPGNTTKASSPTHRIVALSFQFVATVLTLCLTELRQWMQEDTKRLLDQKPRVHLVKETAELVQRMGLAALFPELAAALSEEMLRRSERTLRDIIHHAKFLVRKVMNLKGASLKEEGTLGALLTGGVDHNHVKQDDMLRNAAYRVIEPLLTRWYRIVDPSAGVSWSYRSRGGMIGGGGSTSGGDTLEVVQDIHHHVGLGELISGAELMCLRHPMQHTLVTLLEMWRCVCFKATVVGAVLSKGCSVGGARDVTSSSSSWIPVMDWVASSNASWREQWCAVNLLRCVELLHSSLDSLLQRLEEESGSPHSDIPDRLILSHGLCLMSVADALSNCSQDLGYLPTTRQALINVGEAWMRRVRQYPDVVAHNLVAAPGVVDEEEDSAPCMPGGDHLSSHLDMWQLSETHGIQLKSIQTLHAILLQREKEKRHPDSVNGKEGGNCKHDVLVASTLDRFLEAASERGAGGGIVAACWSQWASSCQPLRLYDEDNSSQQSKDVFEFGATKLADAAHVANTDDNNIFDDASDNDETDDATSHVDAHLTMPLRHWQLHQFNLLDELILRLS